MPKEKAPTYKNLSEVPPVWRRLRGGRLSLDQANQIIQRAYAIGQTGAPAISKAQEEFADANHIENGAWLKGKGGKNA